MKLKIEISDKLGQAISTTASEEIDETKPLTWGSLSRTLHMMFRSLKHHAKTMHTTMLSNVDMEVDIENESIAAKYEADNDRLLVRVINYQKDNDALRNSNAKLVANLIEQGNKLVDTQKTLDYVNASRDALLDQYGKLNDKFDNMSKAHHLIQTEYSRRCDEIHTLHIDSRLVRKELKENDDTVKALREIIQRERDLDQEVYEELQEEHATMLDNIKDLDNTIMMLNDSLNREYKSHDDVLKCASQEYEKLQKECADVKASNAHLQESIDNLMKERAVMTNTNMCLRADVDELSAEIERFRIQRKEPYNDLVIKYNELLTEVRKLAARHK